MPSTQLRQTVLAGAKRIVVKLGTQLLTGKDGRLDVAYLDSVADQVAALRSRGMSVTLVSSGAVGAGMGELSLTKRPTDVADLQAVAAIGQPRLMFHMTQAFARHNLHTAQILLTRGDFDSRSRFLNIRNCLGQLHTHGCVPIVNENDSVAVEELSVGDNDTLAALIANAMAADALVLLTVADGVLDGDNNVIDLIDDAGGAHAHVRTAKSALGTGGMRSKIEAARRVTDAGEIAVIANGRVDNVIVRLFDAEPHIGTVFVPATRKLDSKRRWIGMAKRPAGTVTLDDGAAAALTQRGKSLLAIGVTDVTGRFERGDVIGVRDATGAEIARGRTNYSSDELDRIKGKRSNQFARILGQAAYSEVIHRDNLVVTGS